MNKKSIKTIIENEGITESNNVFVIVDTADVNLNDNLQTRILGIFTDIDNARNRIENLNLANLRWVSDTCFKFHTIVPHVGEIKQIPINVLWTI